MKRYTLALLVLALLIQVGAQSWALWANRSLLQEQLAAQAPLLEDVAAVRLQLQSILLETRRLASEGNENAQRLVGELQRQGVRFRDGAGN